MHSPESFALLLDRQRQLEDHALSLGRERFLKRLDDARQQNKTSTIGAARKLLSTHLSALEAAIQAMIDEATVPGRKGKKHFAVKWCQAVGADVAAYMTVKVVLDGITRRTVLRRACHQLTDLILDELRYRKFQAEAPQLFEYRMAKFSTSNYAHMARSLDAAMRYAEIDDSAFDMPQNVRLLVGTKLIDLLIQTTGMVAVERQQQRRGRRVYTELFLVATSETSAWLDQRNGALELLFPVNLPMIVPPLPWGPNERGGYRFALRGKYPFVRGISKRHARAIAEASMPVVYAAVNRVQETAWRINRRIYDVLQELRERGGGQAGMPGMVNREDPARPEDIETNPESRLMYRRAKSKVREENHRQKMLRRPFLLTLDTAQKYLAEDALYFPANVDFRGRVYSMTSYLSPQGDDVCKGLLEFAQGKPIGEDGAVALALHGANCLGTTPDGVKLSKSTAQERVDWIAAHTDDILRVAADPLADLWWAVEPDGSTRDDAWQFLAFCLEWAGYIEVARRGVEYVSHLPVAIDGTCNGLQHFAAMFRDEIGGTAVNVTPTERPQDIYQRVADHVLASLEQEAASDEFARLWLTSGLLGRKIAKRPTMTFPYGSREFGFKSQLQEYLKDLDAWPTIKQHFTVTEEDAQKVLVPGACAYLAGLIMEALSDIVVKAKEGMDWMQRAARVVTAEGGCVEWVVPATGFPVRQEYFKQDTTKRVTTVLAGKIIKPVVYTTLPDANPIKQANAVAPNFVHSLDAAALMLTVERAAGEGVEAFAMVHDSYGTHAADMPILARCTREAFVEMYQRDVVQDFAEQLKAQTTKPEKVPAVPLKGNLDLSLVLVSDYFFS